MRVLAMVAVFGILSSGAAAQDKCAATEALFNMGIEARQDGDSKRKVRRMLTREMGRDAAEQLADFVFALPDDQLTPAIGQAARAQCEAL